MAIVIYNPRWGPFYRKRENERKKNYETIFIMKYIVGKCNLILLFIYWAFLTSKFRVKEKYWRTGWQGKTNLSAGSGCRGLSWFPTLVPRYQETTTKTGLSATVKNRNLSVLTIDSVVRFTEGIRWTTLATEVCLPSSR